MQALPVEILSEMFQFLPTTSILYSVDSVCRDWHQEEDYLWRSIMKHEFSVYHMPNLTNHCRQYCILFARLLHNLMPTLRTIRQDNVSYDKIRIHLKGDERVGKTCVANQICSKTTESVMREYHPTTAFSIRYLYTEFDHCPIKVELYDHAGSEELQPRRSPFSSNLYSRGKTAVLYTFNLRDVTSLQRIPRWYNEVVKTSTSGIGALDPTSEPFPAILYGNKLDKLTKSFDQYVSQDKRQVLKQNQQHTLNTIIEQAIQMAKQLNVPLILGSTYNTDTNTSHHLAIAYLLQQLLQ
jgi:GTPase SAR1 family protein